MTQNWIASRMQSASTGEKVGLGLVLQPHLSLAYLPELLSAQMLSLLAPDKLSDSLDMGCIVCAAMTCMPTCCQQPI